MNGRRKRILTSLGSLSFATLPEGESKRAEIAFKRQLDKAKPEGESKGAEIAFKRQFDKDLQKEMQGAGEKWNSPSEKWNSPSPPCFARSLPPRGSHEVAEHFCRRKFCEQNFMQARGSREAADNFAEKK